MTQTDLPIEAAASRIVSLLKLTVTLIFTIFAFLNNQIQEYYDVKEYNFLKAVEATNQQTLQRLDEDSFNIAIRKELINQLNEPYRRNAILDDVYNAFADLGLDSSKLDIYGNVISGIRLNSILDLTPAYQGNIEEKDFHYSEGNLLALNKWYPAESDSLGEFNQRILYNNDSLSKEQQLVIYQLNLNTFKAKRDLTVADQLNLHEYLYTTRNYRIATFDIDHHAVYFSIIKSLQNAEYWKGLLKKAQDHPSVKVAIISDLILSPSTFIKGGFSHQVEFQLGYVENGRLTPMGRYIMIPLTSAKTIQINPATLLKLPSCEALDSELTSPTHSDIYGNNLMNKIHKDYANYNIKESLESMKNKISNAKNEINILGVVFQRNLFVIAMILIYLFVLYHWIGVTYAHKEDRIILDTHLEKSPNLIAALGANMKSRIVMFLVIPVLLFPFVFNLLNVVETVQFVESHFSILTIYFYKLTNLLNMDMENGGVIFLKMFLIYLAFIIVGSMLLWMFMKIRSFILKKK